MPDKSGLGGDHLKKVKIPLFNPAFLALEYSAPRWKHGKIPRGK
ncbi:MULTISPECIES: hypothetical protein [unclassified Endozoicomonas]|nr:MULTISPECIES: hypothetical protein [unclassified Endozoicomonas]